MKFSSTLALLTAATAASVTVAQGSCQCYSSTSPFKDASGKEHSNCKHPLNWDALSVIISPGEATEYTCGKNLAGGQYQAAEFDQICCDDDPCYQENETWCGLVFDGVDKHGFFYGVNEERVPAK